MILFSVINTEGISNERGRKVEGLEEKEVEEYPYSLIQYSPILQ